VIDLSMPDHVYHARPELSSTGARKILDSPARFRAWADTPQPPKQAFDLGTAAHAKILGVGAPVVIYPEEHLTPSGNVSTKAATVEWEADQRAQGVTPISLADAARVDAMAEAVLADDDARLILERVAGREVTIIQEIDGVPVRARFDLYGDGEAADLKTSRNASPNAFNRSISTFGYHLQRRWYEDAHAAETGHRLTAFPLIVVESAAPHLVGVYDLDVMYLDKAAEDCRKARLRYRECVETGRWPGYGRRTLTAPPWVIYEDEDEEIRVS
jgi:hypothetical protein